MSVQEDYRYTQSITRKVPGHVRVLQILLYTAVVIFTIIGASQGFLWGAMAVATLLFTWYLIGIAKTTYIYRLVGTRLHVQRVSGFKSHPKREDFAELELMNLRVMAPEDSTHLAEAEAETKDLNPRRITYDISAHDPNDLCAVMYLEGVEAEKDRWLKVYFQPSPELRGIIRAIAPGRVFGYDD